SGPSLRQRAVSAPQRDLTQVVQAARMLQRIRRQFGRDLQVPPEIPLRRRQTALPVHYVPQVVQAGGQIERLRCELLEEDQGLLIVGSRRSILRVLRQQPEGHQSPRHRQRVRGQLFPKRQRPLKVLPGRD